MKRAHQNRLIECAKPTTPHGIVSSADWAFAYRYPTPANWEDDVPQPAASCATVSVREGSAHRGTMKAVGSECRRRIYGFDTRRSHRR